MDRRIAYAVLRRVLPPGVSLPSPADIVFDRGALRIRALRLEFGTSCHGVLFGMSISFPALAVVCEHLELRLAVDRGGPDCLGIPSAPPVVPERDGAASIPSGLLSHDPASAAVIDLLLQWAVQLTSNCSVVINRLVAVVAPPVLDCCIGISAANIALRSIAQAPAGFSAVLEVQVVSLDIRCVATRDAQSRQDHLRGPGVVPLLSSLPVLTGPVLFGMSELQATYSMPLSVNASSVTATLDVSVRSLTARLDTSERGSLISLLTPRQQLPPPELLASTETLSHTAAESSPAPVSADNSGGGSRGVSVEHVNVEHPLAPLSPRLEALEVVSQPPRRSQGGLFSAALDLMAAVWSGADSVREPREPAEASPGAAPLRHGTGSAVGATLARLQLDELDVIDDAFDDAVQRGFTPATDGESLASGLHSSMFASFAAPHLHLLHELPAATSADSVPRREAVQVASPGIHRGSIAVQRIEVELSLAGVAPPPGTMPHSATSAGMPQARIPVLLISLDDFYAAWDPLDVSGDLTPGPAPCAAFKCRLFDFRALIVRPVLQASMAAESIVAQLQVRASECRTSSSAGGIMTARAQVSRASATISSLGRCTEWLELAQPALGVLLHSGLLLSANASAAETPASVAAPNSVLVLAAFDAESADFECGIDIGATMRASVRFQIHGMHASHFDRIPAAVALVISSDTSVRASRRLCCSIQRVSVIIDGTDSAGSHTGSPVPCLVVTHPDLHADTRGTPTVGDSAEPRVTVTLGSIRVSLPWAITALALNALPFMMREAVLLQETVSVLVSALPGAPLVAERPERQPDHHTLMVWQVNGQRLLVAATIPATPDFSSATGTEIVIDSLRCEGDSRGDVRFSCARVGGGLRAPTAGALLLPVLTLATNLEESTGEGLEIRIVIRPSSTDLHVRVENLCIQHIADLAEFAIVGASALGALAISQSEHEPDSAENSTAKSELRVHADIASICVAEAGQYVVLALALKSVAVDCLCPTGDTVLNAAYEVALAELSIHVMRLEAVDMSNLVGTCAENSPLLVMSDGVVMHCSVVRPEASFTGLSAAHIDVELSDYALSMLADLLQFANVVRPRFISSVTPAVRTPSQPVAAGCAPAAGALRAETPSVAAYCDGAPIVAVGLLPPGPISDQTTSSDVNWATSTGSERAATGILPVVQNTPRALAVASAEFESGALLVDPPHQRRIDCVSRHAALAAYLEVLHHPSRCANGTRPRVNRLCDFDFSNLEPDAAQHSSEEWVMGCSPEVATPERASTLCVLSVESASFRFSSDMVPSFARTRPFRGVSFDTRGLCAQFSNFRNPRETWAPSFGWTLSRRMSVVVDEFTVLDALAARTSDTSTQDGQDGQTSVRLLCKAAAGLQEPALRCVIQWVVPRAKLSRAPTAVDADEEEARIWVDVAPLEINLRGRAALFAQRVFCSDAALRCMGRGAAASSKEVASASLAPSLPPSTLQRPLFCQLIAVSRVHVTLSFSPEPGMAELAVGGTSRPAAADPSQPHHAIASLPLLAIDHLELLVRSVRVFAIAGVAAATAAVATEYLCQAQDQESMSQLFTSIPASIVPFMHTIAEWVGSPLRLAATVMRTAGARSEAAATATLAVAASGHDASVASSGWLTGAQHLLGAAYEVALPIAGRGIRASVPVAASVMDSVVRGGRAIMNAAGVTSGAGGQLQVTDARVPPVVGLGVEADEGHFGEDDFVE